MQEQCEFEDLRDFVDVLRKLGQQRTIEGADWDLEIGALNRCRRGNSSVKASCALPIRYSSRVRHSVGSTGERGNSWG